jgi:hypothetical protein
MARILPCFGEISTDDTPTLEAVTDSANEEMKKNRVNERRGSAMLSLVAAVQEMQLK